MAGKIFDKVEGASKDDLANVAKGVVSVISNVLSASITAIPADGGDNSDNSATNSSTPQVYII